MRVWDCCAYVWDCGQVCHQVLGEIRNLVTHHSVRPKLRGNIRPLDLSVREHYYTFFYHLNAYIPKLEHLLFLTQF